MKIYKVDLIRDGVAGLPDHDPRIPRAVGLGYFDGVHRGHRELIRQLVYHAHREGLRPVVFTFDRFPKPIPPGVPLVVSEAMPMEKILGKTIEYAPSMRDEVLNPYVLTSPLAPVYRLFDGLLQPLSERIRLFEELGVEELYLQSYNDAFVKVEPEPFMDIILGQHLNARLAVCGEDYSFGKMAQGRVAQLEAWGAQNQVRVIQVPAVYVGDEMISSTLIRDYVKEGRFDKANGMLGRPFTMQGVVIHGHALGRTVGMPTANTRVAEGQVIPPYGVYLTRTKVDGRYYPSVTNIGMRPTVNQTDPEPLLETCLLDVTMDLYDKLIDVDFLAYMRPELKYPSFLAMSAQIARDIEDSRNMHKTLDQPWLLEKDPSRYSLYVRNTERFSQCTMDVVFHAPASAERLSAAQLLARVITATTEAYPTRSDLAQALSYHYGAMVDEAVYRQGDLAVMNFQVSAIRKGLDDSQPFQFTVDLLLEMLLKPVRDADGRFPEAILEQERQNLLMERRSLDQDREDLSLRRSWIRSLPEGNPRTLNELGEAELIRALTSEDLEQMWLEVLREWEMTVVVSGDVPASLLEGLRESLRAIPSGAKRFRRIPGYRPSPFTIEDYTEVTETHSGDQAMIVMIYDGLPPYNSVEIWTSRVLNMLIGGGPHSQLFEVVREQKALCYNIDSHIALWNSCLVIQSRLYPADVPQAIESIKAVIDAVARGEIQDRDWVSARMLVEADMLSDFDDILSMGNTLIDSHTTGLILDPSNTIQTLRQITRDDLIRIAQKLRLRTIYSLVPGRGEVLT